MKKYKLLRDLPELSKGVVFEHRPYDSKYPDRGNPENGCLILGWVDGNCQGGWCGETYIFPGQLADNRDWFEPIDTEKQNAIQQAINILKKLI